MVPSDLKYTKTHEWARVEGGLVTVGITDFAVHELGDIVFLELPAAGKEVKQEGTFGVVESVKAAVDLARRSAARSNRPMATWRPTSRRWPPTPSAWRG